MWVETRVKRYAAGDLDATNTWFDTGVELSKWFRSKQTDDDIDVQFHKELVDDMRKLMFLHDKSPLAANEHRGITAFAFLLLKVREENQLRADQEAFDGTTSLTPAMMRAAKRKCPPIPSGFEQLERLL